MLSPHGRDAQLFRVATTRCGELLELNLLGSSQSRPGKTLERKVPPRCILVRQIFQMPIRQQRVTGPGTWTRAWPRGGPCVCRSAIGAAISNAPNASAGSVAFGVIEPHFV